MPNEFVNKVALASGETLIDLTADTVDAAHVLYGYTFHGKDGAPTTGANTFDADTSTDTAAVAEILSGKTAHARGTLLTGTMPNREGVTGTITTKAQVYNVQQGYHDGTGTVQIAAAQQALIIAENIREGVTILGVAGSMSGSEDMHAQSKNVTPTFTAQTITPDTPTYNVLSQVTVAAITVTYSDNAAGGRTVTIGAV